MLNVNVDDLELTKINHCLFESPFAQVLIQ